MAVKLVTMTIVNWEWSGNCTVDCIWLKQTDNSFCQIVIDEFMKTTTPIYLQPRCATKRRKTVSRVSQFKIVECRTRSKLRLQPVMPLKILTWFEILWYASINITELDI